MSVKVFVLGRSGSGKSTVATRIMELANARKYPAQRMKDYHILYKMFEEDKKGENFQAAPHGGFKVTNYIIFDKALEKLELDITRETSKKGREIILIEFARDNYKNALSKFSDGFLQDAYFFFIETEVETCIKRIHRRVTYPPTSDHHYVPDEIMRNYFDKDNWSYMANTFKKDYKVNKEVSLYRNAGSIDELYAYVDRFAETIFANEFSIIPPEMTRTLGVSVPVMPIVNVKSSPTPQREVITL